MSDNNEVLQVFVYLHDSVFFDPHVLKHRALRLTLETLNENGNLEPAERTHPVAMALSFESSSVMFVRRAEGSRAGGLLQIV